MKIELDSSQNHYHCQHARPAPGLREASRGDIDMMRETPDHLRGRGLEYHVTKIKRWLLA